MGEFLFLSTLSLRRATKLKPRQTRTDTNFYPRSPCGERQPIARHSGPLHDFYPRSPCGERRPSFCELLIKAGISIHALLAESDSSWLARLAPRTHFYPRSPCGERRPGKIRIFNDILDFYPRSPCGERQRFQAADISAKRISIHALLAESDKTTQQAGWRQNEFLSTLSLRRATVLWVLRKVPILDFYPRSPCGERL